MKIISTTLCNESSADIVGDAIASVVNHVDACLVIDTEPYPGRLQRHLVEAKKAAGAKLLLEHYEWRNDFSHARNMALRFAAKHHTHNEETLWAMTLDPDERMMFETELHSLLSTVKRPIACVWHEHGGYLKERFFKLPLPPLVEWLGPTHEGIPTVIPWPILTQIRFSELDKSPEQWYNKLLKDAEILTEYVKDHPRTRWFQYLGTSYQFMANMPQGEPKHKQQLKAAIEAFMTALTINDNPFDSAMCAFNAAQCLCKLGKYSDAINLAASGLTFDASLPELPFVAAIASYELKDYAQAVRWARLAVMAKEHASNQPAKFLPAHNDGPAKVLVKALEEGIK